MSYNSSSREASVAYLSEGGGGNFEAEWNFQKAQSTWIWMEDPIGEKYQYHVINTVTRRSPEGGGRRLAFALALALALLSPSLTLFPHCPSVYLFGLSVDPLLTLSLSLNGARIHPLIPAVVLFFFLFLFFFCQAKPPSTLPVCNLYVPYSVLAPKIPYTHFGSIYLTR